MNSFANYTDTNQTWISKTGEPIKQGDFVASAEVRGLVWRVVGKYNSTNLDVPWVKSTANGEGWADPKLLVKIDPSWSKQELKFHLAIVGVEWK